MAGFTQLARTCIASSGVDHDIATVESRRRVGSVAPAHLLVADDVARRLAFLPYSHRPPAANARVSSRGFLLRWYERRLAGDYLPASGPFDKDIREAPRPAHIALLSSLESHS